MIKSLIMAVAVFMSTSAFAHDQIKCLKYMEGDQNQVLQMISKDLKAAAKTKAELNTVKKLDVDTMIAAGYVMYCVEDNEDIDMMREVGAK